ICESATLETSSATSATLARISTSLTFRRWIMASQRARRPGGEPSILAECIAHAPHRLDVARLGGIRLDLGADVADVHVDRPLVGLQCLVIADELQQLAARVDTARAARQVAQQVELGRGQRDALAITRNPAALEVDHQVTTSQRAAGLRVGELAVGAAQQRLHAADPLSPAAWLYQARAHAR